MKDPVVLVGIGEMGGVFARGILRVGHPVIPVTRNSNMADIATAYPKPQLVLVSVAENDLHDTLSKIPATWHDRIGLLQNDCCHVTGNSTDLHALRLSRSGSKRRKVRMRKS